MKKIDGFIDVIAKEYFKNGFNITEAYHTTRPKVKRQTAEVEGSKLLRNPKFIEATDKLKEQNKTRYGIDMSELINDLKELKEIGKKVDGNIALKSIDMLIKIAGEYAPTKTENANINTNYTIETNLKEEKDNRLKP
jgi:hypothetical protein